MIIEFAVLVDIVVVAAIVVVIVVAITVVVVVSAAVAVVRLLEHALYGWGKANNGPTEYKYYQPALFPSCCCYCLQLVCCLLLWHAAKKN